MASMNAWPSVCIKRGGSTVVSHKIVKCEWTDTLGAIVERVDPSLSHKKSATLIAFFFFFQTDLLTLWYARETTIAVEVA